MITYINVHEDGCEVFTDIDDATADAIENPSINNYLYTVEVVRHQFKRTATIIDLSSK